jgi:two-component system sensor kinase FixL
MSWVTIIWSMVASACLTAAAIYFVVWCKNRSGWAHFWFSVTAASSTGYAFCELAMMRAQTPAELAAATRWSQVAFFLLFVSITWFVFTYLRAGRRWLAWTITGLRFAYLALGILLGINVYYSDEPIVDRIQFLGEPVTVLAGSPNPMMAFGQSVVLLLLVFVVDASRTAWRRGERRQALMVGGSVVFFILTGLASSAAILWGDVRAPMVVSLCYLGLVGVMAYELSRGVLRAAELVRELQVNEAGLRESEARMSLAVAAGNLGIWIWYLARNEIWTSERWRTLFGFASSSPANFGEILQRLHPDDRDVLRQTHATALAGSNGGTYQTEYRVMLADASVRWISSIGRVEFDGAGQPAVLRGACHDVTARKQAEQDTQSLRHELAHAGRVSMMGQIASGLAHEINQPLAAILRNAEAAELFLQHSSPDLDEIRAILAEIRTDDERAGNVIDRMRGLLKGHVLEARPLELASLVGDVAKLVRVDAATRQIKLSVDVAEALPQVIGDRVQIQQVLLNLVLNGMDALGGVPPAKRRLCVTARRDGAQAVEIAVDDDGLGMSADALARVFEPFFTTKATGMGMGLAISRTIVEAHGGRLWAENRSEGGATFRFVLPITATLAVS